MLQKKISPPRLSLGGLAGLLLLFSCSGLSAPERGESYLEIAVENPDKTEQVMDVMSRLGVKAMAARVVCDATLHLSPVKVIGVRAAAEADWFGLRRQFLNAGKRHLDFRHNDGIETRFPGVVLVGPFTQSVGDVVVISRLDRVKSEAVEIVGIETKNAEPRAYVSAELAAVFTGHGPNVVLAKHSAGGPTLQEVIEALHAALPCDRPIDHAKAKCGTIRLTVREE